MKKLLECIKAHNELAALERLEQIRLSVIYQNVNFVITEEHRKKLLAHARKKFGDNSALVRALILYPKPLDPVDESYNLAVLFAGEYAKSKGYETPTIAECECDWVSRGNFMGDSPRKAIVRMSLDHLSKAFPHSQLKGAKPRMLNILFLGSWKCKFEADYVIQANKRGFGVNAIIVDQHYGYDVPGESYAKDYIHPVGEFTHVITKSAALYKTDNAMECWATLKQYGEAFQKKSQTDKVRETLDAIFLIDFRKDRHIPDVNLEYAFTILSELSKEVVQAGNFPVMFMTAETKEWTRLSTLKVLLKEKVFQELDCSTFSPRVRKVEKGTERLLEVIAPQVMESDPKFSETLKAAANYFDFDKFSEGIDPKEQKATQEAALVQAAASLQRPDPLAKETKSKAEEKAGSKDLNLRGKTDDKKAGESAVLNAFTQYKDASPKLEELSTPLPALPSQNASAVSSAGGNAVASVPNSSALPKSKQKNKKGKKKAPKKR